MGYDGQTRAWLYLLASMTGLRRSELAALEPSSFDLATRTVTVAAAYTKAKVTAVLPLNRAMIPDLRKWLAAGRGPLFPGLAGQTDPENDTASTWRPLGYPIRRRWGAGVSMPYGTPTLASFSTPA